MAKFWDRLSDILLLPSNFYKKLREERLTLYAGIITVGILDIFFPDFIETYRTIFTGKPAGDVLFNMLAAAGMVVLLGAVDVAFFSIPLFDIFKYFKKKEGLPFEASPVKVMKVYIMANLIIAPVITILHYAVFRYVNENSSLLMQDISLVYFFIMLIWPSALISRGLNALFGFNPLIRRFTFIIVFTWAFILGMVIQLQILPRILLLLR